MDMKSSTDRIDKEIVLKAPRSRVWRALTDHREFGEWFRVHLDQPFAAGRRTTGHITYPGYEHLKFEAQVERLEPETYFAFRWHPYAVDPKKDYSKEPATLVEFRLEDAPGGGTRLTVTESGFDRIPKDRRDEAYRMNDRGWGIQMDNIKAHVGG